MWDSTVDYMHFRQNTPDFDKLSTKLVSLNDSAAYCCQCSYLSANKHEKVKQAKSSLNWVCAKH